MNGIGSMPRVYPYRLTQARLKPLQFHNNKETRNLWLISLTKKPYLGSFLLVNQAVPLQDYDDDIIRYGCFHLKPYIVSNNN